MRYLLLVLVASCHLDRSVEPLPSIDGVYRVVEVTVEARRAFDSDGPPDPFIASTIGLRRSPTQYDVWRATFTGPFDRWLVDRGTLMHFDVWDDDGGSPPEPMISCLVQAYLAIRLGEIACDDEFVSLHAPIELVE